MKINLKKDADKLEILAAIGSKDKATSERGQQALAAFVGPVITQVLDQVALSNQVYTDFTYNFDEVPTIPLDLFDGNEEGLIDVWATSMAGGLATNLVHGLDEFRMQPYKLDSAVSMYKKYATQARLETVSKCVSRMAQEIMVKQEYQAWSLILQALAGASTNGAQHLLDATTESRFQLDDLNRMITKVVRLRNSWVGGTPSMTPSDGLTNLIVSPEVEQDIRGFAYQPMNTIGVDHGSGGNTSDSGIPLPDQDRLAFFRKGGSRELFGVEIASVRELGVNQAYTKLFDSQYTAGGGEVGFDSSADDIVLGLDLSVDAFVRGVATDADTDGKVTVYPDDQFVTRQQKVGWYAELEESRAVVDNKAIIGLVV